MRQDIQHRLQKAAHEEVWSCELMLILFELLLDHAAASLIECKYFYLLNDVKFFLGQIVCEGYLW